MHANSRLLFLKYAPVYFSPASRVLEIGPDFPSSYGASVPHGDWDTLDIYTPPDPRLRLTYVAKAPYEFPVPDDRYDVVLSGNVIEHVRQPWVWMREVARVCKPGGVVITIVPISWPHHPNPGGHGYPAYPDCWRIYPDGLAGLYEEAGLETLFATWESLEEPGRRRYIAGKTSDPKFLSARRLRWQRWLAPFGFPVERAYDAIAIGRKR